MDPDQLAALGFDEDDEFGSVPDTSDEFGSVPDEKPEAEPMAEPETPDALQAAKTGVPVEVVGTRHSVTIPTTEIVGRVHGPVNDDLDAVAGGNAERYRGETHGDIIYDVDPYSAAVHQRAAQESPTERTARAYEGALLGQLFGGGRRGVPLADTGTGPDTDPEAERLGDIVAGVPGATRYLTELRNQLRAEMHDTEAAQAEHPLAAAAGGLVGGAPEAMAIPIPGAPEGAGFLQRAGTRALGGAALGAAYGHDIPAADEDERLRNMALGAATGVGGGAVEELGSAALGGAGQGLRRAAVGALGGEGAVERDAALARIRAQGGMLRDERLIAQNYPGGVTGFARQLRESGIQGFGRSFDEMAQMAGAERQRAGQAIGSILEQAGQAGAAPTRDSVLSAVRNDPEVAELLGSSVPRQRWAAERMLEDLDNAMLARMDMDTHAIPIEDFEQIKQDFAREAGYGVVGEATPGQTAYQGGRRGVLGAQESELERVAPEGSGQAYLDARRRFGAMAEAERMASDRAMREASNRLVSPSDYGTGLATLATSGNPLAGLAAMGANRALRRGEHLGAATALEGLLRQPRAAAQNTSPVVRAAMDLLQRAHSGDLDAAAAHFTLGQTNPDYQRATTESE